MTVHERPFGRLYEDFVVGDTYQHWPGKTITEADDHLFCMKRGLLANSLSLRLSSTF